MIDEEIEVHPVQVRRFHSGEAATAPKVVTMRAYEVYCELFGKQEAMVTGDCRGGFGAGELIAFLYAHTFPRSEWRTRFDEALKGLKVGP